MALSRRFDTSLVDEAGVPGHLGVVEGGVDL
jgi:hypothetical protein